MTIQQLKYIITISEAGSFNKASEVLYVAQPSLTNSVQDLERELGVTIFNRSGRGVTLTSDGLELRQALQEAHFPFCCMTRGTCECLRPFYTRLQYLN